MDFSKLNLFRLMNVKMDYANQRQGVLAHNIANVDTPGYKAQDLQKLNFEHLANLEAKRLEMRASNAMHFTQGRNEYDGPYKVQQQRKTYETTPVENSVVLEEQMMKVAQNQGDYQMTTQLYRKMIDMMRLTVSNK